MVEAWSPTRLNGSAPICSNPQRLRGGRSAGSHFGAGEQLHSTDDYSTANKQSSTLALQPCPGRVCDPVRSAGDEMRHGSGEALSRFLTETGLEPGRILVRGCQDDDFVGREPS